MSISRVSRNSLLAWVVLACLVAGCAAPQTPGSGPEVPSLPTFSVGAETPPPATVSTTAVPAPADVVWSAQPVGQGELTVTFYTESDGRPCLRYGFKSAPQGAGPARMAASCAASARATLVALQGTETDAAGTTYSITVGRALSDKVTVVTVEFSNGESLPVPVDEGGFIVVWPGKRGALRAIPIDQYGNMVGERFTFNK